ncbi:heterokaryon incompatibility protein-domain-containing protein, partial [Cercophora samala]
AVKLVAAPVVDNVVNPVIKDVAKPAISGIVAPAAEVLLTPLARGIVQPLGQGIASPVIDAVARPLLDGVVAPVVQGVAPAAQEVTQAVGRGVVTPVARGLVAPILRDVVAPVAQDITVPVVRAVMNPVITGVVNPVAEELIVPATRKVVLPLVNDVGKPLFQAVGQPVFSEVLNPLVQGAATPAIREAAKDLLKLAKPAAEAVAEAFRDLGINYESAIGEAFRDFVFSNALGKNNELECSLCDLCQSLAFYSGSKPLPFQSLSPQHRSANEQLRASSKCRLCALIHTALGLPETETTPDQQVFVDTCVREGAVHDGLGFINHFKVSSGGQTRLLSFLFNLPSDDASKRAAPLRDYLLDQSEKDRLVTLQLIKDWRRTCRDSHDCDARLVGDRYYNRGRHTKFAPFRLIDMEEERLVELHHESQIEYLALSYTWGRAPEDLKRSTLQGNVHQRTQPYGLREDLDPKVLPQVYQDALEVAKGLGYRYIWIDAFCIIQKNDKDVQAQISNMGYVYQNADMTLAAGGGAGSAVPLFVKRKVSARPCLVKAMVDGQPRYVIVSRPMDDTTSVLDSRLWVFQEQILSRRTVQFGPHYTTWRCSKMNAIESLPLNVPEEPISKEEFLQLDDSIKKLQVWIKNTASHRFTAQLTFTHEFASAWYSAICNYTNRNWSNREDQIGAFMGVASVIATRSGWRHLAGLWKEDLPYGLTWFKCNQPYANNDKGDGFPTGLEHEASCAPSWSWAARANGPVVFLPRAGFQSHLVEIGETNWDWPAPETQDAHNGRLTLSGQLFQAELQPQSPSLLATVALQPSSEGKWKAQLINSGVKLGEVYLDAPMVSSTPEAVCCLLLGTLHKGYRYWGVGLALRAVGNPGQQRFERAGLVGLFNPV